MKKSDGQTYGFHQQYVWIYVTNMSVEFWSKNKSCRERLTI